MQTLPDADQQDHEPHDQVGEAVEVALAEVAVPEAAAPNRRRFFAMGATAVASMAGTMALDAQPRVQRGKPLPMPLPAGTRADASTDWKDPVLRLVRRITMGLEPNEVALARSLGYAGYLEYHLNYGAIDDTSNELLVQQRMPFVQQPYSLLKTQDSGEVYNQLADAMLQRAVFSKAQLYQRMVEFWSDHFNSLYDKIGVLKVADDRDVIRPNALGNFPTMLRASSESAAMLGYLDQNSSRKPTPNQNYAREVMELHTLGVNGGYTQDDVAQLSRILTGYAYDSNAAFSYNRSFHDFTAKTFLGVSFPAMASTASNAQFKSEADQAITMLVNHPATATYIATKMAKWLLAYSPPQAVIDAASATYLATGGDIKAMIRTILTGKNLMASPAKYKRPYHLLASSLRGLGAEVQNIRGARQRVDAMDQRLFYWEQPDGYTDKMSWWGGLAIQRWNYATYVSTLDSGTLVRINTAMNFRAPLDTADGVITQVNMRLFGGEMSTVLKTQLTTYLKAGTYSDTRVRETIALAVSSHQYQWY